jgi:hypothetical protein
VDAHQHEELVERLVERGYQRNNINIYPILVGVSGTIYATHTIDTLEQLGVQREAALSCARKLRTPMAQQLHFMVITRRHLEHSGCCCCHPTTWAFNIPFYLQSKITRNYRSSPPSTKSLIVIQEVGRAHK